jgi:hypothetical protein
VFKVVVDGLPISVSVFVCEPSPPIGPGIRIRFRSVARDHPPLKSDVALIFSACGLSYQGKFRLTECVLEPGSSEYSYISVGSVALLLTD